VAWECIPIPEETATDTWLDVSNIEFPVCLLPLKIADSLPNVELEREIRIH